MMLCALIVFKQNNFCEFTGAHRKYPLHRATTTPYKPFPAVTPNESRPFRWSGRVLPAAFCPATLLRFSWNV